MQEDLYINCVNRVLMTADSVGGVWTYSLELARALASYNIEVVLAVIGSVSDSQRIEAAEVMNVSLFESSHKLEWMKNPWDDVKESGQWLLDLEVLTQPDIVHLNQFSFGALNFQSPKMVVGHSCIYSWYKYVKNSLPGNEWETYRKYVKEGLQAADVVIAPSGSMLAELKHFYGPFRYSQTIYNARRSSMFSLRKKEPFIMSAGRLWDEAKNISALAKITDRLNWPLYIAGDIQDPAGESIDFPGADWLGKLSLREMASWLSRAPVFALPARYEPFGLSPLEAALSGCALVLGDIPSLREIWDDAAVFVDPDDLDELSFRLNELTENTELRNSMAKKASRRALYFYPERMAGEYCAVYNKLIHMKQRSLKN